MVAAIVLILQFNTGRVPGLFSVWNFYFQSKSERLAGAISLLSPPCHDPKIRPGQWLHAAQVEFNLNSA